MKVKHITSNISNSTGNREFKGKLKSRVNGNNKEHISTQFDLRNNKTELNTRPAKSINFGGSVSSKATRAISGALAELTAEGQKDFKFAKLVDGKVKDIPNFINKFIDSEKVSKVLKLVKENEALFENIITIFLAGLLKPICVLAMPGAEEKDKQTAATKNFVAAVTGFVMSGLILTPISKSVGKVTNDLHKYVKDVDYIKLIDSKADGELADAFSTFYKKVADLVITPAKAAITIGFMPYVLDFLFGDKKSKQDVVLAQTKHLSSLDEHFKLNDNEQIFNKFSKGEIK